MNGNTVTLWAYLQRLAAETCEHFSLRLKELKVMTSLRKREYGTCSREHVVELRVHQLKDANLPLSRKVIVDTLAHELAHLGEWRHGAAHRELTQEILGFWKEGGMV